MSGSRRRVLVAGGTGDVGEGVVRALLGGGSRVVVCSRSRQRLQALRGWVGDAERLELVETDLLTSPDALTERVEPVDAVVAAVSGPAVRDDQVTGALIGVDEQRFRQVLEETVVIHHATARRLLPLVTGGGRYLMITGGGAEHVKPDDAPVSIGLAGQLMLARALAAEAPHGVRLGALVLESPIAARSRAEVDPAWPSADQVGDEVSRLLELAELPVINRYGRAPVPV